MEQLVRIIGGGLAGSEAAWQLARRGETVIQHQVRRTFARRFGSFDSLGILAGVIASAYPGAGIFSAPQARQTETAEKQG
jgi:folate-dependent tRNA-U54 methylase TrmFO/GidA